MGVFGLHAPIRVLLLYVPVCVFVFIYIGTDTYFCACFIKTKCDVLQALDLFWILE